MTYLTEERRLIQERGLRVPAGRHAHHDAALRVRGLDRDDRDGILEVAGLDAPVDDGHLLSFGVEDRERQLLLARVVTVARLVQTADKRAQGGITTY